MTDQKRTLLQRAITTFGKDTQINKAVEELGELVTALGRFEGNRQAAAPEYNRMMDNIAEEIADVRIMMYQLCMIYDLEERAVQWEYYKLGRLKDRLDLEERTHVKE